MNFGGEFGFGKVSAIRENRRSQGAEIILENGDTELSLYMTKKQLLDLQGMIAEFLITGSSEGKENIVEGPQPNAFDLNIDLEDEEAFIDIKALTPEVDSGFPAVLVLRNPWGGEVHLTIGANHAQMIEKALASYRAVGNPSHTPN